MDRSAKKNAATVTAPTKKRKPAGSRSAARGKTRHVEVVAPSSAQSPAEVAAKHNIPADEPRPIKSKKATTRTNKTDEAALYDNNSLAATAEECDVVRFTLAGQVYGLPVMQIAQVLRIVAFNILPNPPYGMLGVIDFRGRVIPLIDLRRVFDLPSERIGLNTPVLVAQTSDRVLGLVVDEVVGVSALSVGVQVFTDGQSKGMRYISGVARLDGKTMLIVNLEELAQQFPDVVLGAM